MSYIRSEESYPAFQRFEPLLADMIRAHQKEEPFCFTHSSLSPNTLVVRLRDVIRGAIKHGYTSDLFTPDELRSAWGSNVLRVTDSGIYFGPAKSKADVIAVEAQSAESKLLPLNITAFDQIEPIVSLISAKVLPSSEIFFNALLVEAAQVGEKLLTLSQEYDIAFQPNKSNSFIIV